MKKVLMIILLSTMIFCIGCNKDTKTNLTTITYPTETAIPYPLETAMRNGDIVGGRRIQYNVEKLTKFMKNVKGGSKDKIRITKYTTEGGAIITDLDYDGNKIDYTNDTTRDGMGVRKIEKKKFNSIYKTASSYYLKNPFEDILIYTDSNK
jgi:hypothetical protein